MIYSLVKFTPKSFRLQVGDTLCAAVRWLFHVTSEVRKLCLNSEHQVELPSSIATNLIPQFSLRKERPEQTGVDLDIVLDGERHEPHDLSAKSIDGQHMRNAISHKLFILVQTQLLAEVPS